MTPRKTKAKTAPTRSTAKSSRRDPMRVQRIDARRSQILDAAVQVFASKGFHQATVRDIAKKARLADGTLYLYFKNKGDLVLAILNRINESELRAVQLGQGLAPGVDARTFFVDYLRGRTEILRANLRDLQAVLPDILRDPTLRRRYLNEVLLPTQTLAEPVIEAWMKQGTIRAHDPRLLLRVMPSLFLGLLVLRMLGDVEIDALWDGLPEQITSLLFDGLTPPVPASEKPAATGRAATAGKRRTAS
jgi:AcrR family transcriptional regulator